MIAVMSDEAGTDTVEESKATNPYGDVALGVECAWPQDFFATTPAEESAE